MCKEMPRRYLTIEEAGSAMNRDTQTIRVTNNQGQVLNFAYFLYDQDKMQDAHCLVFSQIATKVLWLRTQLSRRKKAGTNHRARTGLIDLYPNVRLPVTGQRLSVGGLSKTAH